jgi:hypothetical protein
MDSVGFKSPGEIVWISDFPAAAARDDALWAQATPPEEINTTAKAIERRFMSFPFVELAMQNS